MMFGFGKTKLYGLGMLSNKANMQLRWKSEGQEQWWPGRVHSGALGACNILFLNLDDGYVDIHYLTFYRNCTFRLLYKPKSTFYMSTSFIRKMYFFFSIFHL